MRRLVDATQIRRFMEALGDEADRETRLYFAGGATAVLMGWRGSTVDVDIQMEPESDQLYRALPRLKERLGLNVELASPDHFIPEVPGWQERSSFIAREGCISFYHYDLYAQALAKIHRGHAQDLTDVEEMLARGLVDRTELLRRFEQIEPQLYRFPAIDPATFRRSVERIAASPGRQDGS
jgi:Nucleotidyltransferase of unknown function (DUF6036)